MLGAQLFGASKAAEGVARTIDLRAHWGSFGGSGSAYAGSGVPAAMFDSGSNWGLAGTTSREKNNAWNMMAWRERGGCSGSSTIGFPIMGNIPAAQTLRFLRTDFDLMVFEAMFGWGDNTVAGVENGVQFCPVFASRPVQFGAEGISFYNDAGTPKVLTRGPGGVETIDISAVWPGGTPIPVIAGSMTPVRFEFRNARSSRPASFRTVVNGSIAFQRDWSVGHKLPDGAAVAGGFQLFPAIGIYSATKYIWYRDIHIYCGPDDDGVLPV